MFRAVLLALAVAGVAVSAAPALASDTTSIQVGPTRVEFLAETVAEPVTVIVTVDGGDRGTIVLDMYDAVIDPAGGWRSVAYGTTEATLSGALSITPPSFAYLPNGGPQRFEATLMVDSSTVSAPRFGSLRVTLRPDSSASDAALSQVGAVEVQVLAAPTAAALEALPSSEARLTLRDLEVSPLAPWTPVDRAIPDLPWVVNHGPALVRVSGRNTGTLVLDSRVTYEFSRLSPLDLLTGGDVRPVFTLENRPRYILAGAPFTDTVVSLIPVDGEPSIDSLPLIGFVRVSATITGQLVGIEAEPVTISHTFLVFPWKESLFLFFVWLFQREWRHRRGRRVRLTADGSQVPSARSRIREQASRLLRRGDARP